MDECRLYPVTISEKVLERRIAEQLRKLEKELTPDQSGTAQRSPLLSVYSAYRALVDKRIKRDDIKEFNSITPVHLANISFAGKRVYRLPFHMSIGKALGRDLLVNVASLTNHQLQSTSISARSRIGGGRDPTLEETLALRTQTAKHQREAIPLIDRVEVPVYCSASGRDVQYEQIPTSVARSGSKFEQGEIFYMDMIMVNVSMTHEFSAIAPNLDGQDRIHTFRSQSSLQMLCDGHYGTVLDIYNHNRQVRLTRNGYNVGRIVVQGAQVEEQDRSVISSEVSTTPLYSRPLIGALAGGAIDALIMNYVPLSLTLLSIPLVTTAIGLCFGAAKVVGDNEEQIRENQFELSQSLRRKYEERIRG